MVAQVTLNHFVKVRVLARQPAAHRWFPPSVDARFGAAVRPFQRLLDDGGLLEEPLINPSLLECLDIQGTTERAPPILLCRLDYSAFP
jgi:hypothetical protein